MRIPYVPEVRFGARSAGFLAYTGWTLVRFELEWRARGLPPERHEELISEAMRRHGRTMCSLFGIEIDLREKDGRKIEQGHVSAADASGKGRVFVLNHRSALDIMVTLAAVSGKHVSRGDIARWPIVGRVATRAGILFVEREDKRSAAAVIHQMIDCVEHGKGVTIFPEGTTFPGDEVHPFKPGAFAVARRTGCEIVPIGIAYAGAGVSFGDESLVEHMRRVAGAPKTRVALTVGEPFRAGKADTNALSKRAREEVQSLVGVSRARVDDGASG